MSTSYEEQGPFRKCVVCFRTSPKSIFSCRYKVHEKNAAVLCEYFKRELNFGELCDRCYRVYYKHKRALNKANQKQQAKRAKEDLELAYDPQQRRNNGSILIPSTGNSDQISRITTTRSKTRQALATTVVSPQRSRNNTESHKSSSTQDYKQTNGRHSDEEMSVQDFHHRDPKKKSRSILQQSERGRLQMYITSSSNNTVTKTDSIGGSEDEHEDEEDGEDTVIVNESHTFDHSQRSNRPLIDATAEKAAKQQQQQQQHKRQQSATTKGYNSSGAVKKQRRVIFDDDDDIIPVRHYSRERVNDTRKHNESESGSDTETIHRLSVAVIRAPTTKSGKVTARLLTNSEESFGGEHMLDSSCDEASVEDVVDIASIEPVMKAGKQYFGDRNRSLLAAEAAAEAPAETVSTTKLETISTTRSSNCKTTTKTTKLTTTTLMAATAADTPSRCPEETTAVAAEKSISDVDGSPVSSVVMRGRTIQRKYKILFADDNCSRDSRRKGDISLADVMNDIHDDFDDFSRSTSDMWSRKRKRVASKSKRKTADPMKSPPKMDPLQEWLNSSGQCRALQLRLCKTPYEAADANSTTVSAHN